MEFTDPKIIQTAITVVVLIVLIQIIKLIVRKFTRIKKMGITRRKVILNLSYLIFYIVAFSALAIIWGIDLKQLTVFLSSILAVLGIAFFAQWSILSNLTASVILFFSHPLRIGDRIRIQDKDFNWIGEVKDISGFYLFMETDKGENLTIPTSIIMQKGIEILDKKEIK